MEPGLANSLQDKCKCLHLGFNNLQYDYFLGDDLIDTTRVEKDLGIQISDTLKPKEHIAYITKKANMVLGCINRTYTDKSRKNMLPLYKTLVRLLIEYCQQVWSPYLIKDIQKVEKVQRRFTKMVSGMKNLTYSQRLERLDLLSLEKRRKRADLIETYKIHTGATRIDRDKMFQVSTHTRTRGHSLKHQKQHTRLDIRKHFFTQRVNNPWNELNKNAIAAKDVNQFKTAINQLF